MAVREKIIQQFVLIPSDVKHSRTKSPAQCLQETKYKGLEGKVNVAEIVSALLSNPDVVDDWLEYSANQRSDTGWYIIERVPHIEVGYYSKEGFRDVRKYEDKIHACAEFIYQELNILIKIAETSSENL